MDRVFHKNGYDVVVSEPTMYVDNQSRGRSGHMSHALAEFAPNKFIDFNSNCSMNRHGGHSTFGWIEYRISEDGGETYGDIKTLPYSYESFIEGLQMISVEKAVACDDGTIVAFCLRNDPVSICQPWETPTVILSTDGGERWSKPYEMCQYKGRVYDAVYHNGVIYALEYCNAGEGHFCGEKPEHLYRIFISEDNGRSFRELCVVPIDYLGRSYGALLFDDEGKLHVYGYNLHDERNIDHAVSLDCGKTWKKTETCYLAKGIRNIQVAQMDGIYIMHGRAEQQTGFVLYTSKDGYTWDEGELLAEVKQYCYYSNNLVLKDKDGSNRLLVQYSESYGGSRVNVFHLWVKIKK